MPFTTHLTRVNSLIGGCLFKFAGHLCRSTRRPAGHPQRDVLTDPHHVAWWMHRRGLPRRTMPSMQSIGSACRRSTALTPLSRTPHAPSCGAATRPRHTRRDAFPSHAPPKNPSNGQKLENSVIRQGVCGCAFLGSRNPNSVCLVGVVRWCSVAQW